MAKLEAQAEAEYRDARRFNATRPVGSRLPQTYDKAEVGFSLLGLLHELLD